MALPQIVPAIVRILPIIVRLFPEVFPVVKFSLGKIIPLFDIKPSSDAELQRNLNAKIKSKASDKAKDGRMVIKVSDAIACAEEGFNATTLIKEFLFVAVRSLVAGSQAEACGQKMFDRMSTCMREKALRQDTPRVKVKKSFYHRPARGHGFGRKF